eukprot:355333-Lingulodinium_polyedra.AAC.1
MRRGTKTGAWLRRTSEHKRWLRPNGDEWRLAPANGSLNTAYHVFRLLAGGAQGNAQRRKQNDRDEAV